MAPTPHRGDRIDHAGSRVTRPALNDAGAIFSPDGRTLAFTRGNEDAWTAIWLWSLGRGKPRLRRLTDDHEGRFKGSLDSR